MVNLPALQNEDKQNLEQSCESATVTFFEWLEANYPHINKITNVQKNKLLRIYCEEQ